MNDLESLRESRQRIVDRARNAGQRVLSDDQDAAFRDLSDQILAAERRQDSRAYPSRIVAAAQANRGKNMMTSRDTAGDVYNTATATQGRSFWSDLVRVKS